MKKLMKILGHILEFSVPAILSFLLVTIADAKEVYLEEYVIPIQILYFIVLFLEWIWRYHWKKKENFFEKYIWLLVTMLIFLISIEVLEMLPNISREIQPEFDSLY